MYVGTNEKLKRKIQEFNSNNPDWFIFSQGDLEPDYNDISEKRYNISSAELRQKLGEIISQRKTANDNIYSSLSIIEIENHTRSKPGPWNY
ncbi:hypothetical protein [endosymbiont GvMRE of Glomus versiforme]|uniref:hypothetical protein n=1 Tax=endosymbiont GvMRE of Glomus versiforme TaxID=2039283 RepID=UPI000ECBFFDC|nr:hypothetical protein [endosymbiont GvMRE of Glomus versiforme]RHZ37763.1 hypothetical protein GvMRE_I1g662 [endosymbiont GvMRE of Glomus versiforme]